MEIDFPEVPEGATHYSDAITDIYFAAFWKGGDGGCWCFALDDRKAPKWIFHKCVEISNRAKPIPESVKVKK